jgi:hypothetical protein
MYLRGLRGIVDFVAFVDLDFLIVTGSSKELTNSEHI